MHLYSSVILLCVFILSVTILSVVKLSLAILSVILSVVIQTVVIPSVVILNVVRTSVKARRKMGSVRLVKNFAAIFFSNFFQMKQRERENERLPLGGKSLK